MNWKGVNGHDFKNGVSRVAGTQWILDESKFLSTNDVKRLLRVTESRSQNSHCPAGKPSIRDYLIVHLALSSGLRVSEIAALKCSDFFMDGSKSSLIVRNGKGSKSRIVMLGKSIKNHLIKYLNWKQETNESILPGYPLLQSRITGNALTVRAIQKAFKRCAERAGISSHYSIHSLRHTYACHLYKASGWNLRLVQKQLGHVNIATTQVYADVMEPDLRKALEQLYR